MPASQPFTALCQALARPRTLGRADLHIHTTASDGSYLPEEIINLAQRSGLAAVAITDHDTLDGVEAARQSAKNRIEVITGVEVTAEYRGKEIHILGYFIQQSCESLRVALGRLQAARKDRFLEMVDALRHKGFQLDSQHIEPVLATPSLGRRNLALLLVDLGIVSSVRQAFSRYLGDRGWAVRPKLRLPVREALGLIREAGGVAAWAHPSYDCDSESLAELVDWGLGALEAEYPGHRAGRTRALRTLASRHGLAISGGSDCHGPESLGRMVGASSITNEDLQALRQKCPSTKNEGLNLRGADGLREFFQQDQTGFGQNP